MLSPSTQHRLTLVFGSMMLLHAVIFWEEWPWIPIGFPDFSIFYTAGKILKQGQAAELYDDRLQEAVQRSFAPAAVAKRGSILPFNHPPFEALFFTPFTAISFLTAYLVWLAINCGILTAALLLLRTSLAAFAEVPAWLCVMMGFGFFPAYVGLVQGQDSIWVLFCYVMAFRALRRDSDFAAGSWLGFGLCKFHLVLPFVLILLALRKLRAIAGFSVVAGCLGVASLAAVGWRGVLSYPGYVLWTDRAAKFRWNFDHRNNPNLHALILSVWPRGDSHLAQLLVISASLALLGIVVWRWKSVISSREAASGESPARKCGGDATQAQESLQERHHDSLQLGMALAVTATLLVSYHTWVQDMAIILLPIFLVLDIALRRPIAGRLLWSSIAALLCSPLYAVLLLRFSQFRVIALVLIAFFVAIAMALRAPPAAKSQAA